METSGWNPTSMPKRETELTLLLPDLNDGSSHRAAESSAPAESEEN